MMNLNIKYEKWPNFEQDEIEAVVSVLKSGNVNYWTGEECSHFENEFAAFIGARHAVSLANGTVALEAALHALGIGLGDDVLVSSRTFIASASCIVMKGARPIVADIDPDSQNVTAETLAAALTPKTKAIVVVHLAGWPCDMDSVMAFAREHGLYVIEDCAQAHGAKYKGSYVGSFGHVAAFSFCQDKIMTTGGEGGMITTNDDEIMRKVWSYKDHGKCFDAISNAKETNGFKWLHHTFGTNLRMTEMQAAIGRCQLKKIEKWLSLRRRNGKILERCFSEIAALRVTMPPAHVEHAYYKYYTFIRPEALKDGFNRDRLIDKLNAKGVPCQSGICGEIYREKAFEHADLAPRKRFAVAQELGATSLMFQVHPVLSEEVMKRVCEVVREVLIEASR